MADIGSKTDRCVDGSRGGLDDSPEVLGTEDLLDSAQG